MSRLTVSLHWREGVVNESSIDQSDVIAESILMLNVSTSLHPAHAMQESISLSKCQHCKWNRLWRSRTARTAQKLRRPSFHLRSNCRQSCGVGLSLLVSTSLASRIRTVSPACRRLVRLLGQDQQVRHACEKLVACGKPRPGPGGTRARRVEGVYR